MDPADQQIIVSHHQLAITFWGSGSGWGQPVAFDPTTGFLLHFFCGDNVIILWSHFGLRLTLPMGFKARVDALSPVFNVTFTSGMSSGCAIHLGIRPRPRLFPLDSGGISAKMNFDWFCSQIVQNYINLFYFTNKHHATSNNHSPTRSFSVMVSMLYLLPKLAHTIIVCNNLVVKLLAKLT